jgi:hypothetical protein
MSTQSIKRNYDSAVVEVCRATEKLQYPAIETDTAMEQHRVDLIRFSAWIDEAENRGRAGEFKNAREMLAWLRTKVEKI